jgi:hypothetical protein
MPSLLSHPDVAKADNEATARLDSQFQNVEQLQLEDLLEQARCRHDELQAQVLVSPTLNVLVSITGSSVVRFEYGGRFIAVGYPNEGTNSSPISTRVIPVAAQYCG